MLTLQQNVIASSYQAQGFGRFYTVFNELSNPKLNDNSITPAIQLITRYPVYQWFKLQDFDEIFIHIHSLPNTTEDLGYASAIGLSWENNWSNPLSWYIKYDENEFNQQINHLSQQLPLPSPRSTLQSIGYAKNLFQYIKNVTIIIEAIHTLTTFGARISTTISYSHDVQSRILRTEEELSFSNQDKDIVLYNYKFNDTSENTSSSGYVRLEAQDYDFGVITSFHFTKILGALISIIPFFLTVGLIYETILSPRQKKKHFQY